jgi:hypothetical protein
VLIYFIPNLYLSLGRLGVFPGLHRLDVGDLNVLDGDQGQRQGLELEHDGLSGRKNLNIFIGKLKTVKFIFSRIFLIGSVLTYSANNTNESQTKKLC